MGTLETVNVIAKGVQIVQSENIIDNLDVNNPTVFLEKMKRRIIESCLPVIIMIRLNALSVSSAADVCSAIRKQYSIKISSGTVYPVLDNLEKTGHIKLLPKMRKKLYRITKKGSAFLVNDSNQISLELALIMDYNRFSVNYV